MKTTITPQPFTRPVEELLNESLKLHLDTPTRLNGSFVLKQGLQVFRLFAATSNWSPKHRVKSHSQVPFDIQITMRHRLATKQLLDSSQDFAY